MKNIQGIDKFRATELNKKVVFEAMPARVFSRQFQQALFVEILI